MTESLFETWYITYNQLSDADAKDQLSLDDNGAYKHHIVFWMHKAFRAGQVLEEKI